MDKTVSTQHKSTNKTQKTKYDGKSRKELLMSDDRTQYKINTNYPTPRETKRTL